ncbi:MAG: SAM-dependent methyltransferase [Caulobacter sp.]|nr:SAM-dependent methyltransferase [Caulobacter sp.]
MALLAWLIFIPLQILWLPLSILGALWVAYKQIGVSKRLGLSQTAVEIINGRWTADVFGLRKDTASRRLAGKLPNNSVPGLGLALFPLMVARLIAGRPILYPLLPDDARAGIANMVFNRTARFDSLIAANAADAGQLVVLGAGLDTRCYGPLARPGLAMFELDQTANQRAKRKAVKRAGLNAADVRYIEVDFALPQWIASLTASDYDPSLKTVFLWEGVTLYLTEADVRATLAALKANAAPGSVVLLDLYATRFIDTLGKGATGKTLQATGEGMGFGLDFSGDAEGVLKAFADSAGLRLDRHYFLGLASRNGAFMVVAELVVGT